MLNYTSKTVDPYDSNVGGFSAGVLHEDEDEKEGTETVDKAVEKYIEDNKDMFKTGDDAKQEFDEVIDTLNVDDAFKFEFKDFDGIPCMYMKSAKSDTLLQVYFAIKEKAGHIELSVKELLKGHKDDEDKKDDEDAEKDNDEKEEKDSEEDTNKMLETVQEAIDALYLKATLTESTELAEACIAKAEELREAISEYEVSKEDTSSENHTIIDTMTEAIDALYLKATLTESTELAEACIAKAEELREAMNEAIDPEKLAKRLIKIEDKEAKAVSKYYPAGYNEKNGMTKKDEVNLHDASTEAAKVHALVNKLSPEDKEKFQKAYERG